MLWHSYNVKGTILDVALNKTKTLPSQCLSSKQHHQILISAMKKKKVDKGLVCDEESYFSKGGEGELPWKGSI